MSATLGTLLSMAFYIGLVAGGAVLGSRRAVRSSPMPWLGRLQRLVLLVIIAALGIKMGANEEVTSSLGRIGLSALLITLLAMAGSTLALYLLRRFVLRLDRWGLPLGSGGGDAGDAAGRGKADNSMTKWIILAVGLGMLAGYLLIPDPAAAACGPVIDLGLYLLLFLVGVDMGRQGTMLAAIKAAGWKVLLVPVSVAAGTLGGAAAAGLLLPMGLKDAIAASAGFGWYSLAPTLLAPYSLSVSAVAFLSNAMREIFSLVSIPFVARHLGYVECAALPGAAAMDTVLPVVVGSTHERIAIYSFASGVVLSLAVPVLVPAITAL